MILLGFDLIMPASRSRKRVETDGVLRIVVAPLVVAEFRSAFAARSRSDGLESAIDHARAARSGSLDAEVGRLQDRAQRPLGRNRVLADELLVRRQHAAKVLRPWPVQPRC